MTNKPKTGDFLPPVFFIIFARNSPGRTIDRRRILWDLRGKDRIFFPIAHPHTYHPSFLQCHTNPTPNCHTKLILNCHAELVSASHIFFYLLVTPDSYLTVMLNSFQHLIYFTNKDKRINRITRSWNKFRMTLMMRGSVRESERLGRLSRFIKEQKPDKSVIFFSPSPCPSPLKGEGHAKRHRYSTTTKAPARGLSA